MITHDKQERLYDGFGAYYNEWLGVWYSTECGMLYHAQQLGYTQEDIKEARTGDDSYMYFTEYDSRLHED